MVVVEELHVEHAIHLVAATQHSGGQAGREGVNALWITPHERGGVACP